MRGFPCSLPISSVSICHVGGRCAAICCVKSRTLESIPGQECRRRCDPAIINARKGRLAVGSTDATGLSSEACGALGASSGIAYNYTQCSKKFPGSDYATMGSLALWTFGERKTVVEKVTRDARSEHRTQLHQATRTPPLRVERHSAARETDHALANKVYLCCVIGDASHGENWLGIGHRFPVCLCAYDGCHHLSR
jgi:hypothetical protein